MTSRCAHCQSTRFELQNERTQGKQFQGELHSVFRLRKSDRCHRFLRYQQPARCARKEDGRRPQSARGWTSGGFSYASRSAPKTLNACRARVLALLRSDRNSRELGYFSLFQPRIVARDALIELSRLHEEPLDCRAVVAMRADAASLGLLGCLVLG